MLFVYSLFVANLIHRLIEVVAKSIQVAKFCFSSCNCRFRSPLFIARCPTARQISYSNVGCCTTTAIMIGGIETVSDDGNCQLSGVSRMAFRMSREAVSDWRIASGLVPLRWHAPRRPHGRNRAGSGPTAHMSLCASTSRNYSLWNGPNHRRLCFIQEGGSASCMWTDASGRKDGRMRRCFRGNHITKSSLLCGCCWPISKTNI